MKTFLFFFSHQPSESSMNFKYANWSFAWVGNVVVFKTMKNRKVFQLLLDSSFVVSVN